MKTEWDYTELADAYLQRPDYAESAIDDLVALAGVKSGDKVCDVGAGVAHLTLMLAQRGLQVVAVEPNDAMRGNGIERTRALANVNWFEGTGEATGQPEHAYKLVTFGSSFNVTNRPLALKETQRILEPSGWFACMWNHRDLDDPIQSRIEAIIREFAPEYGYGTRREDQTDIIDQSGLFKTVHRIEGKVLHHQSIEDCIEAWRSHATLQRQVGERFAAVVEAIAAYLRGLGVDRIPIPYVTNMWAAQLKD
ncbi:class I SAM-dependent methyltransferase [Chitiniphilus eburneus]|uniref:Methyltransferase domain-containing protein n=1 Tax=Chitiniphilus eburneus TaxID=2571148 RepID=A0A4U0Q0F4_9NEIS|nr:methyltransferase domain-containing protein [Chitiniphilus eburneus]TJZ74050.1 methyltransferase domain-containing protein [Chitiniphilus eburneus]